MLKIKKPVCISSTAGQGFDFQIYTCLCKPVSHMYTEVLENFSAFPQKTPSHKFAKAIFFGNNQEFNAQSKEEQEIIVNCRRLIQNAIVLWNYLYISDLLVKEQDIRKQKAILQMVQNKSMMWWRHMNFYGEYDFTIVAKIIHSFDMEGILQLDVGEVLKTAS